MISPSEFCILSENLFFIFFSCVEHGYVARMRSDDSDPLVMMEAHRTRVTSRQTEQRHPTQSSCPDTPRHPSHPRDDGGDRTREARSLYDHSISVLDLRSRHLSRDDGRG